MLVLGLSGSLRRDSHNRKLLRAAASELPSGGDALGNEVRLSAHLELVEEA